MKHFFVTLVIIMSSLINVCLYAQNCSHPNATIISFANGNTISTFFTSGTLTGNVIIMDHFHIQSNFTFNNALIYVEPNIMISVNSHSLNVVNGTVITACAKEMWYGIIASNSGVSINIVNSFIQDAVYGVGSDFHNDIYVTGSEFNRNHGHISFNSDQNSVLIENSEFLCNDPVTGLPDNALLPPYSGQRTETGIDMEGYYYPTSLPEIGTTGNGNFFNNLDYGIWARNSTVSAVENRITNSGLAKGTGGIHVRENAQLVAQNNEIHNFETGIYTTLSVNYFLIHQNLILDCVYGITNENNGIVSGATPPGNSYIRYNTIENDATTGTLEFGITNTSSYGTVFITDNIITDAKYLHILSSTNGNMHLTVARNQLYNPGSYMATGIYVAEIIMQTYAKYEITDNYIDNIPFGINVTGLNKSRILRNNVKVMEVPFAEPQLYYPVGIFVQKCHSYTVNANEVLGAVSTMADDEWTTGYKFENNFAPASKMKFLNMITCNTVEDIGRGFWFGGFTPGIRFIENEMHDCTHQFYLKNNVLGLGNVGSSSNPADNRWMTTPVFSNTFSDNSNASNLGGFTKFHVVNTSTYVPSISPVDDVIGGGATACEVQTNTVFNTPICGGNPIGHPVDDTVDDEMRIFEAEWGDMEEYEWIAKYYLYSRVKSDTTGIFEEYEYLLEMAENLEETNIGLVYLINDAIERLPFDETQAEAIADIIDLNSTLTPSLMLEEYIQHYTDIYCSFLLSDTVSINQKTRLVQIAEGCPYTEGFAVYSARVLLSLIDRELIYYTNDCEEPGLLRSAKAEEKLSDNILLYPNPASDIISIYPEIQNHFTIEIYDFAGRTILNREINSSSIDISSLKTGMYLYRIILNDEVYNGKFSVIR